MRKNVNTLRFCLLLLLLVSSITHSQSPLQAMVDDLLQKADGYLAQDQLRTPAQANAFDRYRAVLILDSDNPRAKAGIDAIARRYLEMASNAARRGSFASAKARVADAVAVGGDTDQSRAMLSKINQAQIAARRAKPKIKQVPIIAKPDISQNAQFVLDKAALTNRNKSMVTQLQSLGLRVQDSREYVLIHARNDAEGRWIYQQMRNASKNYRLRGDIRRSKTPKVILQDPLE